MGAEPWQTCVPWIYCNVHVVALLGAGLVGFGY